MSAFTAEREKDNTSIWLGRRPHSPTRYDSLRATTSVLPVPGPAWTSVRWRCGAVIILVCSAVGLKSDMGLTFYQDSTYQSVVCRNILISYSGNGKGRCRRDCEMLILLVEISSKRTANNGRAPTSSSSN